MSAQDALWHVPNYFGDAWWLASALMAGVAAFIMFATMILHHPFSALLVARILIVGSLVAFAMAPLNSGWVPFGVMLASAGGLMASILIATGWCERPDQSLTIGRALLRWLRSHLYDPLHGTEDAGDD